MKRILTMKPSRRNKNPRSDIDKLFQKIQDIRKLIDLLKADIENVKKLHGEILATPIVHDQRTQELDTLNSQIKSHSIGIKNKLKQVKKVLSEQTAENACKFANEEKCGKNQDVESECSQLMTQRQTADSANLRIHKMQYSTYLRIYTEVINEYNEAQMQHRDKCRLRLKRQLEITNSQCSEDQIDNMIEEGNFAVFTQGIVTETKEAKRVLEDLKARHTDLMKLEKSIEILHDLFADIAIQIETQGDTVDSIEKTVLATVDSVQNTNTELKEAVQIQRSYNKKRIILASVLGVIVLIIVLLVIVKIVWL